MGESTRQFSAAKHVILVLSGKGGVGKSTVATQLAVAFSMQGKRVGLLDIDLCGPSIPRMLKAQGQQVQQSEGGWLPIQIDALSTDGPGSLSVMSIGFLLSNQDDAVVWRGPKKTAMIQSLLQDVNWAKHNVNGALQGEDLDFLIVDTPPGTGDEHITIVECLKSFEGTKHAVMVTTPQGVALADVRREFSFCTKAGIPVLGLIENMSGFVCQHCSECTNIFSSGGGESLANALNCYFLGRIPIDPQLCVSLDEGSLFLQEFFDLENDSPTKVAIMEIANQILNNGLSS
eukprot:Sdes_comp14428_c0_seq1m3482